MPTGDKFFRLLITEDQVCACPVVPVNFWQKPDGTWMDAVIVNPEYVVEDAEAYLIGGYVAWVIICPMCELIYARGGK